MFLYVEYAFVDYMNERINQLITVSRLLQAVLPCGVELKC